MVSCAGTRAAETTGEEGRAKAGPQGHVGETGAGLVTSGRAVMSQDVLKFKRGWGSHAVARVRSP